MTVLNISHGSFNPLPPPFFSSLSFIDPAHLFASYLQENEARHWLIAALISSSQPVLILSSLLFCALYNNFEYTA